MTGSPLHHSLDYIELVVTDLEKSKDFFREAFGWGFHDYGPGYAGIVSPRDDGNESGGLMLADEPRPVGGPLVLLYSEDLDATQAAIEKAGGAILQAPYEFPGGRRLHFADPTGNELGVWSTQ
ncbi:VOC family protein [Microbacterium aurugineum]|uniref:VOC family protein n=1 Tax=Microbacterium aurugineum TaxID=2851642 RepID=A0ABY4IYS1_9MICO|nr:VOC family protein [Microbacterium aurugineum]UPL17724.1 VOC family protein [Microbacterium aurugineum]